MVTNQPTFGLDGVEVLQGNLGNYPLWQYAAFLVWVLLAFVAAPVVDWLLSHVLKRLTAKTETDLDDRLLEILHRPVKVAVVLVMLNVGLKMFQWPSYVERILGTLFTWAVALTIIYIAVRLVDLLLEYFERKFFGGDAQLSQMMLPVLGKTCKVFVVIIGLLTTAQHLGFPITSVIAGLGIGGVAVALAAQNTLANVFGSVTILADRPFRVGDFVRIETHEGLVEQIGLRSTRVRTPDGNLVTIPNKTVADSAIVNLTARPTLRQQFTIGLTYDTSPEKLEQAVALLKEIVRAHPLTHDVWVYWRDFSTSSLDILVIYWCKSKDVRECWGALQELNLEIKRRFDAAGLEFAYPTQTIHLRQENA